MPVLELVKAYSDLGFRRREGRLGLSFVSLWKLGLVLSDSMQLLELLVVQIRNNECCQHNKRDGS